MPYSLQLDPAGAYLDLRYHGVVPVAQRVDAWAQAKPILLASGVRRILIDLTQASAASDPVAQVSAFVARIGSEPLLLASRTAFVAPRVHFINHLVEVLADARHYPFSRFTQRDHALAWLLGDTAPTGLALPE